MRAVARAGDRQGARGRAKLLTRRPQPQLEPEKVPSACLLAMRVPLPKASGAALTHSTNFALTLLPRPLTTLLRPADCLRVSFHSLAMAAKLFAGLAFVLAGASAAEEKKDLPANDSLRIGVRHKPATCDRKAKDGDSLSMHYTGKLYTNGEKFDSSLDRDSPFEFTLGRGQVIKGWDEGIQGMCVGEKRKLVIPSGKGYGASGSPPKIPGGATLVFDIELLNIK